MTHIEPLRSRRCTRVCFSHWLVASLLALPTGARGETPTRVVPTVAAAIGAVKAGVDGLVVEGAEGGGFKSAAEISSLVLLQGVRAAVDVPIIAAGGICDGRDGIM